MLGITYKQLIQIVFFTFVGIAIGIYIPRIHTLNLFQTNISPKNEHSNTQATDAEKKLAHTSSPTDHHSPYLIQKTIRYTLNFSNIFEYKNILQREEWRKERVSGIINDSLYLTAKHAGLSNAEIAQIESIFKHRINFSRSIYKGDKFQIVRNVEYINGKKTGITHIESARIQQPTYEHTAFLFSDGHYYDKQGTLLNINFSRVPLSQPYRISSRFNSRRKHPITGKIGPHNGVDFAVPKGTPIFSTGDGTVTRIDNHPFAGHYIEIEHDGIYKTRYLHLGRVLVNEGDRVRREQTIALSGNSGRSTGPHLHFELHINDKPVDPIQANILTDQSLPKRYQSLFVSLVNTQTGILNTPKTLPEKLENTCFFLRGVNWLSSLQVNG